MTTDIVKPKPAAPGLSIAVLLVGLSLGFFVVVALATGETAQLGGQGIVGLLQRMVALGLVALGQTFVILVGSIDLSVAALISAVAVLASHIMQGDPAMILPAIVICLGLCLAVGLVNGALVAYGGINPLIATLGTGLVIQGVLAASFGMLQGAVMRRWKRRLASSQCCTSTALSPSSVAASAWSRMAGVMFGMAWRSARTSRAARISATSRTSSRPKSATRTPRRGMLAASPCASSRRNASRTGTCDAPNSAAM